jgi:hypothetical protein
MLVALTGGAAAEGEHGPVDLAGCQGRFRDLDAVAPAVEAAQRGSDARLADHGAEDGGTAVEYQSPLRFAAQERYVHREKESLPNWREVRSVRQLHHMLDLSVDEGNRLNPEVRAGPGELDRVNPGILVGQAAEDGAVEERALDVERIDRGNRQVQPVLCASELPQISTERVMSDIGHP